MENIRPKTPDDVRAAFDQGTVVNASRKELAQLLLANGRARILHDANQARASEMGETMRQLLAARQSEEIQDKAGRIAIVALTVSIAALCCSGVQAYYTYVCAHRDSTSQPALRAAPTKP